MQVNENNRIDARTFPEIWKSCTEAERIALRSTLIGKLECAPNTFWNYCQGNTTPQSTLVQKEISRAVKSILHVNVSYTTLFPNK